MSVHNYIPRCMSTQHPDHANNSPISEQYKIRIADEIKEAHYVLNDNTGLHCDEVMLDLDGKSACNRMVAELFSRYGEFFMEKKMGEDVFITIRIPNPEIEKAEAKIIPEILGSIPRSYDAARSFYGDDLPPPIFEVILPMTTSVDSLNNIYYFYANEIIERQNHKLPGSNKSIGELFGEFSPEKIDIIPLFEDMEHLLNAHVITERYILDKNLEHQRVFLARSDPALNYGLVSAVLLNKIALANLDRVSRDTGIEIYPISGVGSAPFRGNLKPETVKDVAEEYPSVHTFTIQSSFKYDHPKKKIIDSIKWLKGRNTNAAHSVDTEACCEIIRKYSEEYQKQVEKLAPIINNVAAYVPKGRERRLNVGLFGYARKVGEKALPRAIPFTAACYSIGFPPEIIGLNALGEDDIRFVKSTYVNFEADLIDALAFLNPATPFIPGDLKRKLPNILDEVEPVKEHTLITDRIIDSLKKEKTEGLSNLIHEAAKIRRFLG